jgi:hypothetical protein
MALKTVIANELRKWGILSVQMVKAIQSDQGVVTDVDSEVTFPDVGRKEIAAESPNISTAPDDSNPELNPAPKRGRPKKSSDAGQTQPPKQDPHEQDNAPAPASEPIKRSPKDDTITLLRDNGVAFTDFRQWLSEKNVDSDADSFGDYEDVPSAHYVMLVSAGRIDEIIKKFGGQ